MSTPHPDGLGAERALDDALARAGIDAERGRPHQPARHGEREERRGRGGAGRAPLSGDDARELDQGRHRPHARRRRHRRGGGEPARDRARPGARGPSTRASSTPACGPQVRIDGRATRRCASRSATRSASAATTASSSSATRAAGAIAMSAARGGTFFVDGVAFWAPTLPGWDAARAAFRGEAEPLATPAKRPAPELLAAAERRRAPDTVALALEVAAAAVRESGLDAATLPSIFTSAHGDLAVNDYMCSTLATRADADLADQVPQLGAQRRRRLLDDGHRLPRGEHRAQRVRRELRRRPARGREPVPGRRATGAAGRLRRRGGRRARVGDRQHRPARLRAGAVAARERAHASAAFDWSLVQRDDRGAGADPLGGGAKRSPATRWPAPCRCSRRSPMAGPGTDAGPLALPLDALARAGARGESAGARRRRAGVMTGARVRADSPPRRQRVGRHDVVITGGGLAGLTLALQLKQSFADLDILVLERRVHPVPIAAHKVGESTVEIGANYLSRGARPQAAPRDGAAEEVRLSLLLVGRAGATSTPSPRSAPAATSRCRASSSTAASSRTSSPRKRRGAASASSAARSFATSSLAEDGGEHARRLSPRRHRPRGARALARRRLRPRRPDQEEARARRAERRTTPTRSGSASRTGSRSTTGPSDPAWRARCTPPARWLSTNHLVGEGYWAWLIPLASGSHSVGIVADAKLHPLATMNTFAKAMEWLEGAPAAPLRRARRPARRCSRTSPSCATSRTAASSSSRPSAGRSPARRACSSTRSIRPAPTSSRSPTPTSASWSAATAPAGRSTRTRASSTRSSTRSTRARSRSTRDQYPIFGDPEVLPVKVIWDYTYYWGVLAQFFFQRRLADLGVALGAARRAGALPGAQPRGAGAAARVVGVAAARTASPTRR